MATCYILMPIHVENVLILAVSLVSLFSTRT